MALLLIIFSFLVLILLAYLIYAHFSISPSITPLVSVSFIMIILYIFSLINILFIGTIIVYLLIILLFFARVIRSDKGSLKLSLTSFYKNPGLLFFVYFSLFLIFSFYIKNQEFDYWDEISHWGPFYKSLFYTQKLHIFYDSNLMHPQYLQGLTVFSYFLTWYQRDFYQFLPYISLSIITTSAMASVFSLLKPIKHIVIGLFMIIYVISFSFFSSLFPYYTLIVDFTLGILFGAGLMSLYYVAKGNWNKGWILIPIITSLTIIKDTGIIFAGFILALWLINIIIKASSSKMKKRNIYHYCCLAATLVSISSFYIIWNKLLSLYNIVRSISPSSSKFIDSIQGIISQTPTFYHDVTNTFIKAFISTQPIITWPIYISMLVIFIFLSILSTFVYIAIRKIDNKDSNNCLILLGMPLLFIIYSLLTFILIITLFTKYEALLASSFDRYVSTFIVGWILLIFGIVFSLIKENLNKLYYLYLSAGSTVGIAVFIILLITKPSSNFFITRNFQMTNSVRSDINHKLKILNPILKANDRVWIISQGDKGLRFWIYHYILLPNVKVIGNYIPYKRSQNLPFISWSLGPEKFDGDVWSTDISPQQFIDNLIYFNIKYVIVDVPDEYLYISYQNIFSDKLDAVKSGKTILYEFNTITKLLDPVNT